MSKQNFSVSIQLPNQLDTVLNYKINTVYIPFDFFYINKLSHQIITDIHNRTDIYVGIILPDIIRLRDTQYLDALKQFLLLGKADKILVRNLEEIGFIQSIENDLNKEFISINGKMEGYTPLLIEADYSLYTWNKESLSFILKFCQNAAAPLELSLYELKELENRAITIPIYGKVPLMVSANCIKKTCGDCSNCGEFAFDRMINDRKNKMQLVYTNCIHCFNKLYNSIPSSYHKQMYELIKAGFNDYRIDFTNETPEEIGKLLTYYINEERSGSFPVSEYTTGHILKGAI